MARMRSPNYPAHDLESCVKWAEKIWSSEGRTVLSPQSAAVAAGYKGLSGPSRTVLASLKKFGLLEDVNDGIRISALALEILHANGPEPRRKAIQEAALAPGLFNQLFQSHAQASIQAIAAYLITRLEFSQTGARACAEAFKESLHFAGLDEPVLALKEEASEEIASPLTSAEVEERQISKGMDVLHGVPQFRWPLTGGRVAEITISKSNFTEADLDLLCAYLNLAKRSIVHAEPSGQLLPSPIPQKAVE